MKRVYVPSILMAFCMLSLQTQGQENKPTTPMMDTMSVKKKLMEPEMMMAAEKAMMSDKSMVPSMIAKEMMMHDMMKDEKNMSMVEKQAKMMQEPAMAKMLSDESMMMKSESMGKDPAMMKGMMKDAMMRQMSDSKMMMKDKK